MSKVPHSKLESEEGGRSSMEYRSEQSLLVKQPAKFPVLPFRLLDEESWLSGSELKTDNSTSEDEEVRRSFVGGTKTKLRSKNKKKISSIRKVMTFSSSNSSSATTSAGRCSTESYHQRVSSTTRCTGDEQRDEEEILSATRSLWSSTCKSSRDGKTTEFTQQYDEKHWRPKRGSISLLPGSIEQIQSP